MAFRLNIGEQERNEGIRKVSSNNAEWLARIRKAAVNIARANGIVTTDDLRRYANRTGDNPGNKNAWGAVFRGSPEPGYIWQAIGYRPSAKETNHARRIAVWRLVKDHKRKV